MRDIQRLQCTSLVPRRVAEGRAWVVVRVVHGVGVADRAGDYRAVGWIERPAAVGAVCRSRHASAKARRSPLPTEARAKQRADTGDVVSVAEQQVRCAERPCGEDQAAGGDRPYGERAGVERIPSRSEIVLYVVDRESTTRSGRERLHFAKRPYLCAVAFCLG